ncbi:MAG: zinc ribbon domain-containing protein [Tepidisphaeraceae bacterium]
MEDPFRTLIYGMRRCPECGADNLRGQTHCTGCGQRLRNRNPLLRLLITLVGVMVVVLVVWWEIGRR